MHFSKIHIQNFRNLTDVEFTPDQQLNVFVGVNGAGKTNYLKAILIGCAGLFIDNSDIGSSHNIKRDDIRHEIDGKDWNGRLIDAQGGTTLQFEGEVLNQTGTWKHRLAGKASKTTIADATFVREISKDIVRIAKTKGNQENLPLVAFYPTSRTFVERKLFKTSIPSGRMRGYYNALTPASNVQVLYDWYIGIQDQYEAYIVSRIQDGNAITEPPYSNELELIRKNSIAMLFGDYDAPASEAFVRYLKSKEIDDICVFYKDRNPILIDSASDGHRNLFWLVFDLTFRAVTLNPHLGKNVCQETKGVVLVDEVDIFLHPGTQQRVLGTLAKLFPKIQFFVTTHSPQVLSSVEAKHIFLVKDGALESTKYETFGDRIENITVNVLGAPPRLKSIDDLINEYRVLIAQGNGDSDQAKVIRSKLEEYPYTYVNALLKAFDFQIAFLKA